MGKNQYLIRLTDEQRDLLNYIIDDKNQRERAKMRSRILLRSDLSVYKDTAVLRVADELGTTHTTVQTVRREFHLFGLNQSVFRKIRTDNVATRRINTKVREQIVELAGQNPPEGYKRWTLRLLAEKAVEQGIIDRISIETVSYILEDAGKTLK